MSEHSNIPATKEAIEVIEKAQEFAFNRKHEYVTFEHFILALLDQPEIQEIFDKMVIDRSKIILEVDEYLNTGPFPQVEKYTSPSPTTYVQDVIQLAVAKTVLSSQEKIKPVDLLVQMMNVPAEDSYTIMLLHKYEFTSLSLKKYLSHGLKNDGPVSSREDAENYVEQYAKNLNKAAVDLKIDPLIGRALEVDTIIQIIARRTKNNAVLVGHPGTGKTAIAEGLALKIVRKEVPEAIANSTVYALDVGLLVAGTRFRGDFEERVKQVLSALELIPESILFIDEIHMVMGAGSGSEGTLDVSNLLKPALAKGRLRCIGATTFEEYRKHFEKDRALNRRFKKVDVLEPSVADTKLILKGLAPYYEEFHGVKYLDEALDAAVELTAKYQTNAYLPDKAIDIIDQAGAKQRVTPLDLRKIDIGLAEIEIEVAKVTHIPAKTISEDETVALAHLEENLAKNIVAQPQALEALTDAIYMQRAGLRAKNKTVGSYLFSGNTGVGKTATALVLAETLGIPLIKYDMSDYMEKHSVAKLIGAPPGYVGYSEGDGGSGKLINDVSSTPRAVVLLDEIEKAHPDVFNIFLQIMDDGKIISASGKPVDFRNIILIMTTNAGASDSSKKSIGFGSQDKSQSVVEEAIKKTFSPEFRNRLDAIVQFNRLEQKDMLLIVRKFLKQLEELSMDRKVSIEIDPEVEVWLAKAGYDPQYGARPLDRVITENIKKQLARLMLSGPLVNGGVAKVTLIDDKIVVSV